MIARLFNLVKYFIPDNWQDKGRNPDSYEEYNRLLMSIGLMLCAGAFPLLMFILRYSLEEQPHPTIFALPLATVIVASLLFYIKHSANYSIPVYIFLFVATLIIGLRVLNTGGLSSSVVFWFAVLPVASSLVLKGKKKHIFNGFLLLVVTLLFALDYSKSIESAYTFSSPVRFVVVSVALMLIFALIEIYEIYRLNFFKLSKNITSLKSQNVKMKNLGKISAGLAHEINNPLQIVNGNIERIKYALVKQNKKPEEILKMLRRLESGVKRIHDVNQKMSIFAHKDLHYERYNFNLCEFIRVFSKHEKNKIRSKELWINFQCPTQKFFTTGNEELLIQILRNLIQNSSEAFTPEQAIMNIDIELKPLKDNKVALIYTDNGQGVKGFEDQIMEPFYTTKGNEHVGFGLALVKIYCDYLGWKFYLNRDYNKEGCQFYIVFPMASVHIQSKAA